jgi:hypothetical protein
VLVEDGGPGGGVLVIVGVTVMLDSGEGVGSISNNDEAVLVGCIRAVGSGMTAGGRLIELAPEPVSGTGRADP